jgi:hypothetical protein
LRSSNARPGLAANLRKNICRPPQKTGRAGLSGDDLLSQGFASSALGSILPPSQKAAGLASAVRNNRGCVTSRKIEYCAIGTAILIGIWEGQGLIRIPFLSARESA